MTTQSPQGRPFVGLAIAVALFFTLVLGVVVARQLGQVDPLNARRIGAIGLGIVLIAAGNLVPKMHLLQWLGCRPDSGTAAERIAGWTLVLTGAAVVSLWLFAPGENTMLVSSALATTAFALLIAASALISARGDERRKTLPRVNDDAQCLRAAQTQRLALFHILFALFWVFAMFLADSLWGGKVVLWMAVAFSIALAFASRPLVRLLQSSRSD